MDKYEEGSVLLAVEPVGTGDWYIYTLACESGRWIDDESLGAVMADTREEAKNSAITLAVLAGYAPTQTYWSRMCVGPYRTPIDVVGIAEQ